MKELERYLSGKTVCSVPQLQKDLGLSYAKAAEMLRLGMDRGWIAPEAEGVVFAVNTRSFPRQGWTPEQCAQVSAQLDEIEVDWLTRRLQLARGNEALEPDERILQEKLSHFLELGLVHCFWGRYFLSVSDEVLQRLQELQTPLTQDDTLLMGLCDPIISLCALRKEMPAELLEMTLLPGICKDYIRERVERLLRTGEVFQPRRYEVSRQDETRFKFELMEAFLASWDLETKDEYDQKIRDLRRRVMSLPYCTPLLRRIVSQMTRDIQELSLMNIREIRHLIHSD